MIRKTTTGEAGRLRDVGLAQLRRVVHPEHGPRLAVRITFDAALVAKLKKVFPYPSRQWDPVLRMWLFALELEEAVIRVLVKWELGIFWSPGLAPELSSPPPPADARAEKERKRAERVREAVEKAKERAAKRAATAKEREETRQRNIDEQLRKSDERRKARENVSDYFRRAREAAQDEAKRKWKERGGQERTRQGWSGGMFNEAPGARQQQAPPSQRPPTSSDYAVLGVDDSAGHAECRAAYRKLAQKFHPDRGGDPERMKQVNAAWSRIKQRLRAA